MKAIQKDDLTKTDWSFGYQPALTVKLDAHAGDFDQALINEITLWKVNRYPIVDADVLCDLNEIRKTDKCFSRPKVRRLLLRLLDCHGIQLPMASTFLRFKNPALFQIIDQRAYRAVYGKELDLPGSYNQSGRKRLATIYIAYLRELRKKCVELGIPFEQSDRILYNADKRINKDAKLANY